ncbi:hypothetical protein [Roseomonas rosulenta]|uniref:hypothetical protein n=1 Tax=Roseomonas rosulenta TaxID=2748667 RepID=UPI0018DF91D0|nr:hypothetical protein [Roseomonas rosulenta]
MADEAGKLQIDVLVKALQDQAGEYRHVETLSLAAFALAVTVLGTSAALVVNMSSAWVVAMLSMSLVALIIALFLQVVGGFLALRVEELLSQTAKIRRLLMQLMEADVLSDLPLNPRTIVRDGTTHPEPVRRANIFGGVKALRKEGFPFLLLSVSRSLARGAIGIAAIALLLYVGAHLYLKLRSS